MTRAPSAAMEPCPFCGSSDLDETNLNAIECRNCTGAVCLTSGSMTRAKTRAAWNRRALSADRPATQGGDIERVTKMMLNVNSIRGSAVLTKTEDRCLAEVVTFLHEVATLSPPDAAVSAGTEWRDDRQRRVHEWCVAAFGDEHATNIQQRGVRLLEEAIEAYQATGAAADMAHKLIDFIFAKPADPLARELGGVGLTLLALAQAAGLSADAAETAEFDRVLAKPLSHFTARNQAKNDAGFNLTAPPPPKPKES